MTRFIAACDTVTRAINGLVLGVHHSGHDKTRMRGNTALYAACDAVLAVTRPVDGWAQLTNNHDAAGKAKDSEEMHTPATFRLDPIDKSLVAVQTEPDDMPEPTRAAYTANRRKDPSDRLVELAKGLRALELAGTPKGTITSVRALADAIGCSPSTAHRIIETAINQGRLTADGRHWKTTPLMQW
jgi:hypothetical protein